MQTINVDNAYDFAVNLIENYELEQSIEPYYSIDVVAMYDEAKIILSVLIAYGYDILDIQISDEEATGYNKEYVISICHGKLFCSPAWHQKDDDLEDGYYGLESDECYVFENCSSSILDSIDTVEMYEVDFQEVSEDDVCEINLFDLLLI